MDAVEGVPAIPDILCLLLANEQIQSPLQTTHALLCNPEARFFTPTPADIKWACGYKNFQVMLSCLLGLPEDVSGYLKTRLRETLGGSLGPGGVPSISQLQILIEHAWGAGFDVEGSQQLGGKLQGTSTWIGATDVAAACLFLGIQVRIVDFPNPSGPSNGHPRILDYVEEYFGGFSKDDTPVFLTQRPPIYFQHQGHSVSIIGIERTANGQRHLLQYNTGSSVNSLKDIRCANLESHRAYQLLRIVKVGPYETEQERDDAKVLKSIRIV